MITRAVRIARVYNCDNILGLLPYFELRYILNITTVASNLTDCQVDDLNGNDDVTSKSGFARVSSRIGVTDAV